MATLLDLRRLATFTDGDPGLEAELLDHFVATAAGYLNDLAEAVDHADRWQATAHSLKGAAGNIGAVAMAELAAAAERSAPDPAMLTTLAASFAATLATVQKRAAQRPTDDRMQSMTDLSDGKESLADGVPTARPGLASAGSRSGAAPSSL